MYIHELNNWPHFTWDNDRITNLLSEVSFLQGSIIGKMKALGFDYQREAVLASMTDEITKSSEIEGELLNVEEVRSSIARRLDISNEKYITKNNHYIDGVIQMMFDATHNYDKELTLERLCGWHAALFPTGYSGMYKIKVGDLRDDRDGPMQVVSFDMNAEKVYYQAPPAKKLPFYMKKFLYWINHENQTNPIIKTAIAHLWFITLHPFEDGNGRISRAITDMMFSRAEKSPYRFYSMSAQIQKEKKKYYNVLEYTQKGNLDITVWLEWFLRCMAKSIRNSEELVDKIVRKALYWQEISHVTLDKNQQKMINMLLDGFEGKLTSSKWAKICKCSQDTAGRSIKYLINNNILKQEGDGRSTHYTLNYEVSHSLEHYRVRTQNSLFIHPSGNRGR